jgi:hypothetical protein
MYLMANQAKKNPGNNYYTSRDGNGYPLPEIRCFSFCSIRASLGTIFFHGIFIFPREISSFFLGKVEFPN